MDSGTLKELIMRYGLPLEVKKEWWFGDYFFRAEKNGVTGTVSGSIIRNGSLFQVKSFAESETMVLCHGYETVQKILQPPPTSPNPNGLDMDKSCYKKGITKIYVNKCGVLRQAYFDRFELKNGKDVIFVILDGDTSPSFYGFPSKYLFSNKDDASRTIDKENRKDAKTESTSSIANAFCHLPSAEKASGSAEKETQHEKAYHEKVDNKLYHDLQAPKADLHEGEQIIADGDNVLREELIAARENGYIVDDHSYISHSLGAERANRKIVKAQAEITRIYGIKRKPYFARIDCGTSKSSLHTAYIGDNDIAEYVIDWRRSDVGNAYYHSELYMNHDDVFLALKRIITIEDATFRGYVDEINRYSEKGVGQAEVDYSKNSDALLTKLLTESRIDKKTHDIIKTIQGEQYDIITSDFQQNAVINGCAGSGKTMILYHRLAYMAYNYKSAVGREFDPEHVYIISPSRFFDLSNNELMKKLAIDKVRQAPFYEQVEFLTGEYCMSHGMIPFHRLARHLTFGEGATESLSNSSSAAFASKSEAISKDVAATIEYREWILRLANALLERNEFSVIDANAIPKSEAELSRLFNSPEYFLSDVFVKKDKANANSSNKREDKDSSYEPLKYYTPSCVTTISYENVLSSLEYSNKRSGTYSTRTRRIGKNNDFLLISLSPKTKSNSQADAAWNIPEFWSLVDNATAFEKMLGLITIQKILGCLFLPKNNENDLVLKCLFIAQSYFRNSRIEDVNLYILQTLSKKYGEVIQEASLIFVDEFQNYSSFELSCLRSAFARPVFNLFGDYDQRIEDKGADLRSKIKDLLNPNSYNIIINYRNARQITDYINKTVHKNMQSIGIDGSVQETCIADCQFGIKNRTAIICKDKKQTQHFLLPIISSEKINNVSQTGELLEGQFNLISIQECKGLEFDTVYVIDFDMFENEKYVAYTRALGQLIVLKDNLAELLNRENEEKRRKEEERKKKVAEERKHIESQASKAKEKEKCIGDLIAVLTQILEKQIKTAKEKHECVEALAGALTQILDKRMREEAEKQKKEIRDGTGKQIEQITEGTDEKGIRATIKTGDDADGRSDGSKDRVSEKEKKLEEEITLLAAYCEELKRRDIEKEKKELERKSRIYELAIGKLQAGTPELLQEAIYLLETIADYNDSTEQMIHVKMKLEQIASAEEERRKNYRTQNLCQHCGGSFKGFGKKYCRNCGRKKDY